ncbi:MAG: hypothetical protein ABI199_01730 [Bacteroidia bacterium]
MKISRTFFLFFVLIGIHFSAQAQFMDSLRSSIHKRPKFFFSFNSRSSFITNNEADIWGFVLGVNFNDKINIGGGFNTLNTTFFKNKQLRTMVGNDSTVKETLSFFYWSYYVEYIFYSTKHWQFSIPFQIGIGNSDYQYVYRGVTYTDNQNMIIPIEPVFSITYQFNKWLGFGTNIGYRFMLVNNAAIKQNFNSPTYDFGIQIYYIEIFKSIFPHCKITKKLNSNSD